MVTLLALCQIYYTWYVHNNWWHIAHVRAGYSTADATRQVEIIRGGFFRDACLIFIHLPPGPHVVFDIFCGLDEETYCKVPIEHLVFIVMCLVRLKFVGEFLLTRARVYSGDGQVHALHTCIV